MTERRLISQSGRNSAAIERENPHVDADAGGDYSGNSRHRVTITVSRPSPVLSPNGRGVWQERAREAKRAREEALYAALEVLGPNWQPWAGHVRLLIRWCAKGRIPDLDNAAARLKYTIDGIVAAGLMSNDDQIARMQIERGPVDGCPYVELVFERDGGVSA